ncbi:MULTISPECIES: DUF6527 family protein [Mesorhizobium]|uniref:Uncharacterized protein n=1 Tax=Mesorhizobium opportunistum (strain LMG 24607 / HAMBI 3007 / WSM2075) TaxID=536019 RepID=F7Y3V5_MESOW|nr:MULTISPECIES: DUF6527 family protein [Mesorhizobium]AEH90643.1 hypothetical protein Mesop_6259 [Mesorhizobium opportunistum WSM2075]
MWSWLLSFLRWVEEIILGPRGPKTPADGVPSEASLADVSFARNDVVEKTPPNDAVRPGHFISVVHKGRPYWALFRCPCGCGDVVSLPTHAPHNPRWRIEVSLEGRPTLHPSVWRTKGCLSHFWLSDGRVYWCEDTGVEPWRARPDIYARKL